MVSGGVGTVDFALFQHCPVMEQGISHCSITRAGDYEIDIKEQTNSKCLNQNLETWLGTVAACPNIQIWKNHNMKPFPKV